MLDLSAPKLITFIASVVLALAAVVIHYAQSQFRLAALASPGTWWLMQCLLPGMCSETFRVASVRARENSGVDRSRRPSIRHVPVLSRRHGSLP